MKNFGNLLTSFHAMISFAVNTRFAKRICHIDDWVLNLIFYSLSMAGFLDVCISSNWRDCGSKTFLTAGFYMSQVCCQLS